MKVIRRTLVAIALVAATVTIGTPSASATDSCYGSSCVGLDPSNTTCANDAKSIASKDIPHYGLLEMRWSRSCNAGWARFIKYTTLFGAAPGIYSVQDAYVSAWTDRGTQDNIGMLSLNDVWWGRMVDFGRPEVCVGTRLTMQAQTDQSFSGQKEDVPLDWVWGPCVR